MVERVSTGGLKSFDYKNKPRGKLDVERRKGIEEGYKKYYERKARERKARRIVWVVAALIVLIVLAVVFLRSY